MHLAPLVIPASCCVAVALAAPAIAQEVRQLGPHVHGESHLTIAAEGNLLAMELHAPGNDIVGFEFVPSTEQQRAAVAAATTNLRDPTVLFGMPAAAQCSVGKSDVTLAEEEEDEQSPASGATAPAPAPSGTLIPPGPKHSEFQVAYELTCNNVAAITSLNFTFFAKFPNAMVVHVELLSRRGAFEFEVERGRPTVNTGNMF